MSPLVRSSLLGFAVDDTQVNPGLLGFAVVALLGVATWLLIVSMMRHLRRAHAYADAEQASRDQDTRGDGNDDGIND